MLEAAVNRSRFRYTTSRCVALKNVVDNSGQSGDASRVSKHTARSCQAPLSCQAVEVTKKIGIHADETLESGTLEKTNF